MRGAPAIGVSAAYGVCVGLQPVLEDLDLEYEEAAASPQFKKVLTDWRAFRANQHRWFSIADTRAELAVYRSAS